MGLELKPVGFYIRNRCNRQLGAYLAMQVCGVRNYHRVTAEVRFAIVTARVRKGNFYE